MKKKIILLLLLFVMLSVYLNAQARSGFVFGLGSTGFTGDDVNQAENMGLDFKNKVGICAGYFVYFPSRSNFKVRTEFAICTRGANFDWLMEDEYGDMYQVEGSYNFVYLNVPVTGIYKIDSAGYGAKPYFGGGLSIGLPISAKIKVSVEGQSADDDILDELRVPVIGYQFCGGIDLRRTFIELRYDQQINSLFDASGDESYNKAIWLLLGLKLGR